MKTLEQEFAGLMAKGWPLVPKGSPQWNDLQQAFMGGALVTFVNLRLISSRTEPEAMAALSGIQRELDDYHRHLISAMDIYESLIRAAEEERKNE